VRDLPDEIGGVPLIQDKSLFAEREFQFALKHINELLPIMFGQLKLILRPCKLCYDAGLHEWIFHAFRKKLQPIGQLSFRPSLGVRNLSTAFPCDQIFSGLFAFEEVPDIDF
jgi:hypothetical protein